VPVITTEAPGQSPELTFASFIFFVSSVPGLDEKVTGYEPGKYGHTLHESALGKGIGAVNQPGQQKNNQENCEIFVHIKDYITFSICVVQAKWLTPETLPARLNKSEGFPAKQGLTGACPVKPGSPMGCLTRVNFVSLWFNILLLWVAGTARVG